MKEDVEKQWSVHKPENKDSINWAEYRENVYGFLDEESEVGHEEEHGFSYRKMEERDQRRWNLADLDHNGELSREEFQSFLHPEDADHMRDIVITETLEDIDRDGDGRINVDEYIGDMYKEGEEGSEGESIELINCKLTKTTQSVQSPSGLPPRGSSLRSSGTVTVTASWTWRRSAPGSCRPTTTTARPRPSTSCSRLTRTTTTC